VGTGLRRWGEFQLPHKAEKLDFTTVLYQGMALQLAEKCQRSRTKRQGTTSVVP
jgi:hypothetical protein